MRRPGAPAAAWLTLAALAALAWRQGLAFAVSTGGAGDVEHMLFDAADNPPWLIAIVSAALLFSRRRDLRRAVGGPGSPAKASLLLAPGLALLAWARFVSAPDLALIGSVAMAIGVAWLCVGAAFARVIALPLALLGFAVPAPGALVNAIVYPLQLWTADYAYALLGVLGGSAMQSADVIRTARHTFLVIEGCSGLGSMEVLTLLALAWAWQVGASFHRGLILALAAPLIAFGLNGPRVLGLVLFPESPVWSGHTTQGVVVFAVGALLIALVDRLLEPRAPAAPPRAPASPAERPPRSALLWMAVGAGLSLAIPSSPIAAPTVGRALLPAEAERWIGKEELEIDRLFLGSVRSFRDDRKLFVADPAPFGTTPSPNEPARAEAFVAEDARQTRSNSVRSPKHRVPGRGWKIEAVTPIDLPGRIVGERVIAQSGNRRVVSWLWYVGVESLWVEAWREALALDQSPWRRPQHAFAIRLTTDLGSSTREEAQAERRLADLGRNLRGILPSP